MAITNNRMQCRCGRIRAALASLMRSASAFATAMAVALALALALAMPLAAARPVSFATAADSAADGAAATGRIDDGANGEPGSGESGVSGVDENGVPDTDENGEPADSGSGLFDSLFFDPSSSEANEVMVRNEISPDSVFDTSDMPDFEADAYILIDRRTGLTIASKDPERRLYPASTTKIMTAILALEMGKPDDVFTASARAIRDIGADGSNIGIIAGESMRLDNLLQALLVKSANEAANIIAEGICGDREEFIGLMNKKATSLGARNTHFANTNGYHHDDHYTTALDLAIIANYAMDNASFRELVSSRTINLAPTNKHSKWDRMWTTNQLLLDSSQKGFTVTGIKTGYTSNAGYCLVASGVDANGMELLCVVLGVRGGSASARRFQTALSLLEYGYKNYSTQAFVSNQELVETVSVIGGSGADAVDAVAAGTIRLFLPSDREKWKVSRVMQVQTEIAAPVIKGEKLGYVEYRLNGKFAGMVNVVAAADVAGISSEPTSLPERKDTGYARDAAKMASGPVAKPAAAATAVAAAASNGAGADPDTDAGNTASADSADGTGGARTDQSADADNNTMAGSADGGGSVAGNSGNSGNAGDRSSTPGAGTTSTGAAEQAESADGGSVGVTIARASIVAFISLCVAVSAARTFVIVRRRRRRHMHRLQARAHARARAYAQSRGRAQARARAREPRVQNSGAGRATY